MKIKLIFILAVCFSLATAFAQGPSGPAIQSPQAVAASDIDGIWLGTLNVSTINLRIAFHLTSTAAGLTATMDSLDQNAKGLPVASVVREGSSLKMDVKIAQGQFTGEISKDLQSISGTWSQGGNKLPLLLSRVKDLSAVTEISRPQTPKRPLPYHEEEVSYANPAASGVKLAGTLTIPSGKGPFPAVLLITGSGPQDRDETIFGHQPFFVLSDYLTRKGVAVLRVDDRGIAKSTGNFATATTADFATDAEAGIAFLKQRAGVDPKKIGLIGHSEGGVIAPMVAARNRDVAFIVMMAGSAVPGDQILTEQVRLISVASGFSGDKIAAATGRERDILDLLKSEKDPAAFERKLRERMSGKMSEGEIKAAIAQCEAPWFHYFVNYDPAPSLRKVSVPVLALNGQKDVQVSPQQNLPAIRKLLGEAGNKDFETAEIPGLNHLFQTSKIGAPAEYSQIEETIAPIALDKIATWVLAHTQ
jgi:pimeloyl-ACP methyl ester carboxylesterase